MGNRPPLSESRCFAVTHVRSGSRRSPESPLTLLGRRQDVDGVECEEKEGGRKLVAKKPKLTMEVSKCVALFAWMREPGSTYVNRVAFVVFGCVLDFAHHDEDGRGAGKDAILGPQVVLPSVRKMRDALLEELHVDLDVRHGC